MTSPNVRRTAREVFQRLQPGQPQSLLVAYLNPHIQF